MSQNLEKITQLMADRKYFSDALPALNQRYNDWLNDSRKPCGYYSNSKNKKCEEERANSGITAAGIKKDIENVEGKILQIDNQIKLLTETQTATNTATVTLANKGFSLEALTIKAEGEVKAVQDAAVIKANAEAQAIKETSNASAINETFRNRLIYGVIAVVILAGVFIAFKIYSKK